MANPVELLDLTGLTYYDEQIKKYIKTADVGTVNGHTVNADVPTDAKFTDTTYENATTTIAGLMSASDKSKLDGAVTSIKINGTTKSVTDGEVDLGTIVTDAYSKAEMDTELGKKADTSSLATVATSGLYSDLTGAPTELPASDVKAWAKADSKPTYTAAEVGALPDTTKIPSALSELTTDSTHKVVTDSQISAWNAKSDFSGSYNDLDDKPTIPSIEGLATVEQVNKKADAATTLAGYNIGDAYTKTEVDGLIPDVSSFITKSVNDLANYYLKTETYTQAEVNALVSAIPKFAIAVVETLPTTEISATTIYLLKTSTTESGNLYTEYIYVNNNWEKLGTQTLDLSGYATKDDLNGKVDVVDGKGLSTNDFTTAYKTAIDNLPTSYAPTDAEKNIVVGIQKNGVDVTVDANRKVNITVPTQASDIGAMAASVTHLSGDVPTTRKINNKALSADIALTASDVGALDANTPIPTVTDTYSATSSDAMSGKAVASAISNKMDKVTLATVATTGSFNDLVDVTSITNAQILALFNKTTE